MLRRQHHPLLRSHLLSTLLTHLPDFSEEGILGLVQIALTRQVVTPSSCRVSMATASCSPLWFFNIASSPEELQHCRPHCTQ